MISVATSVVTLFAMWLIAKKDWRGWLVGLVNQALWLWLIVDTQAWGLLILTGSLSILYTAALIKWRREEAV